MTEYQKYWLSHSLARLWTVAIDNPCLHHTSCKLCVQCASKFWQRRVWSWLRHDNGIYTGITLHRWIARCRGMAYFIVVVYQNSICSYTIPCWDFTGVWIQYVWHISLWWYTKKIYLQLFHNTWLRSWHQYSLSSGAWSFTWMIMHNILQSWI